LNQIIDSQLRIRAAELWPGVLIAFTIAAAARFISEHYGAPAMLFALLIGMAFHFLTVEGKCVSGVEFTSNRLLKIGVALLGARVSFEQIASLGVKPFIMVPFLIILTILGGIVLSKVFSRSRDFGLLTGGAVAICGASAALALSSVLPKTEEMRRDTLFTVVAVTSLSTVAMVLYPVLFGALGLSDEQIGILIGATIHDVAQVVGAGYAVSDEAGDIATYVKLLRVACLPVVIFGFAFAMRGRDMGDAKAPFPWFAVGFAAILGANSFGLIPETIRQTMDWISRWFLIAAISALGMKTSLKAMVSLGPNHIGLVVVETLLICGGAILFVWFF